MEQGFHVIRFLQTEPKVSLIVADVDGSLLTEDKRLTPCAVAAVRELDASGIALAITSGRPPRGMTMLIEPLALRTPLAGFNGGVFVHPDMTVIHQHMLPPPVTRRAVGLLLKRGLDVWIYSGQEWFIRDATAAHVEREQRTVQFAPTVIDDLSATYGNAIKIVGVSDDRDLVANCEREMQRVLRERASVVRSQPYYLDVTHPDANKGNVVTTLSRLLSIPPDEIATIGEMPNDVLMFRESGMSIAMGNASIGVQKQAHFVTDSYREDGFAKAVRRFILPSARSRQRAS